MHMCIQVLYLFVFTVVLVFVTSASVISTITEAWYVCICACSWMCASVHACTLPRPPSSRPSPRPGPTRPTCSHACMHTYRSDSTELLTRHRLRAQELKKLEDVQKQADEYAMHACMHAY